MKFKAFWIILLLNIFTFQLATAQFAIIKDQDGYTNIRELPTIKSKVIDKVKDFEVFWSYEYGGDLTYEVPKNWKHVLYDESINEELVFEHQLGFMHESRIQYLSDFEKLNTSIIGKNNIKLKNDSSTIEVKIKRTKFSKEGHKIEFKGESQKVYIDNKPIWGDDEIPNTIISSVEISMNTQNIEIPKSALDDLYNPSLNKVEVYVDDESETLYIEMQNSDGAYTYYVVWVIRDGKYHSRFVGHPYM